MVDCSTINAETIFDIVFAIKSPFPSNPGNYERIDNYKTRLNTWINITRKDIKVKDSQDPLQIPPKNTLQHCPHIFPYSESKGNAINNLSRGMVDLPLLLTPEYFTERKDFHSLWSTNSVRDDGSWKGNANETRTITGDWSHSIFLSNGVVCCYWHLQKIFSALYLCSKK